MDNIPPCISIEFGLGKLALGTYMAIVSFAIEVYTPPKVADYIMNPVFFEIEVNQNFNALRGKFGI